jgi:ketosteroid isomerase-like protein
MNSIKHLTNPKAHMKCAFSLVLAVGLSAGISFAETPESASVAPPITPELAALPAADRKVHEELIAFRIAIQDAFNKMGASGKAQDMAPLLELVHPDCLLTAMNGQSVRGKSGIMDYFHRHMVAEGHAVARLQHEFTADHLSILLSPDIAINRGTSRGTYAFTDGTEFEVMTRWTATMARDNGRWTVASFQFGPSIFDNPVLDAVKGWIYKGAAIAGVAGLLIGLLIGRWTRRSGADTKR